MVLWVTTLLGLLVLQAAIIKAHFNEDPRQNEPEMRTFSQKPGVMVSFERPIYEEEHGFLGFDGWNMTNDMFGMSNVSFIVRAEFSKKGFRENRIRRYFKRFWLPGALWVERIIRDQHIYSRY